jgi:hypothetical protein
MLGLLFIAMTISVIAISVGWYSASTGDIELESASVSVTTADNDFKINYSFNLIGQVDSTNSVSTARSYLGEDGINDVYMLLFKVEGEGTENITTNSYISSCNITKPKNETFTYASKIDSQFQIKFANYTESYGTCTISDTKTDYILIIFGNGTDPFKFSDISYMGTTFQLQVSIG